MPCREWFYNAIMPVFVEFAKSLKLAGPSFEEDIALVSSFYSKAGIRTGSLSSFGVMIEPKTQAQKKKESIKTSRNVPWQILGRNVPIKLPADDITKRIGCSGEVDMIVYANMNIYLIELKAANLDSKKAVEYCRKKAPIQCAKYSHWVRTSPEFRKLLQDNKITKKSIKTIRVLACSSGGFDELYVKCEETMEYFAIVPEYILFSVMAGLFTLSLKEPFPSRIKTIAPGLRLAASKNRIQVLQLDVNSVLRERMAEKLLKWLEMITFDRRRAFDQFRFDAENAKAFAFFGSNIVLNEVYLEDVVDWILPKPLLIGEAKGYKFYIGTQIGGAGTSLICENCKSAMKFYKSKSTEENEKIGIILRAATCPFCGNSADVSKLGETLNMMTMLATEFKRILWVTD
jgi:hypothetical protein